MANMEWEYLCQLGRMAERSSCEINGHFVERNIESWQVDEGPAMQGRDAARLIMLPVKHELKAHIGIQHGGRVFLTIYQDGKEMLHEEVASRAVAEMKINALEEARKQQVNVTVETNL